MQKKERMNTKHFNRSTPMNVCIPQPVKYHYKTETPPTLHPQQRKINQQNILFSTYHFALPESDFSPALHDVHFEELASVLFVFAGHTLHEFSPVTF